MNVDNNYFPYLSAENREKFRIGGTMPDKLL